MTMIGPWSLASRTSPTIVTRYLSRKSLRAHHQKKRFSIGTVGQVGNGCVSENSDGKILTGRFARVNGGVSWSRNCMAMDMGTAQHGALLPAELRHRGEVMPIKDSLIAASARQHGLIVATRNVRDFQKAGVATVNPFDL